MRFFLMYGAHFSLQPVGAHSEWTRLIVLAPGNVDAEGNEIVFGRSGTRLTTVYRYDQRGNVIQIWITDFNLMAMSASARKRTLMARYAQVYVESGHSENVRAIIASAMLPWTINDHTVLAYIKETEVIPSRSMARGAASGSTLCAQTQYGSHRSRRH